MSKKGLSFDEKRNRMLQIFNDKKDVFQLKDLEKIGPQEKGIVMQSVKEVVVSLVDDGLVDAERIGTSMYYWGFPSKRSQCRKRKLEDLESSEGTVGERLEQIQQETKRAKLSRNDTPERDEMIAKIVRLRSEQERLTGLLKQYEDCDPVVIAKEEKETKEFLENANRWTENIFAMKSFLMNKFNMESEKIYEAFGIPVDLDLVDETDAAEETKVKKEKEEVSGAGDD